MNGDPATAPFKRLRLAGFDYSDPDHAYFVTICARQGTEPFKDQRVAEEVIASLHWLGKNAGLKVYAYCLMPDHLHLLVQLDGRRQELGRVLARMKSFTTTQSWKLGLKGQLWQGRFYDHILRRSEDGRLIVEYILANPVRKGLVTDPSEYAFSGMPDPM